MPSSFCVRTDTGLRPDPRRTDRQVGRQKGARIAAIGAGDGCDRPSQVERMGPVPSERPVLALDARYDGTLRAFIVALWKFFRTHPATSRRLLTAASATRTSGGKIISRGALPFPLSASIIVQMF